MNCTAGRPPPERKPVGRAQVPPDRQRHGQRQRRSQSQRRVQEHRQDQTARTSGAARRPGRRFHGTHCVGPGGAAWVRDPDRTTPTAQERSREEMPERRGRSNRSRCAPLRLKGRVIRSRIGKDEDFTDEHQTAEALGGSAAGTWAELPRESGPVEGDSERPGTTPVPRDVPIMAPLGLRRPEGWPRRRGAEGGLGSETPHRTRRCYGTGTGRPENARDANAAEWSSREPPAERREGAKNAASKRGMAPPAGRVKATRINSHPTGAKDLVAPARWGVTAPSGAAVARRPNS